MTSIELADSAVKIGLGATIAGAFAVITLIKTQGHDLRKDRLRRRQDVIEKISASFEEIHSVFMLRCAGAIPPDVSVIVPGEKLDDIFTRIKGARLKLHEIEGRLYLLGLPATVLKLHPYRTRAAAIYQILDDQKHPELADDLCTLKVSFYEALSKNYSDLKH